MTQRDAAHLREQLHREMAGRPTAGRSERNHPGLSARTLHDILGGRQLRGWRRHQHLRDRGDIGDRGKVLERVEAHSLVDMRADGQRAARSHVERVSVRRGLGGEGGADDAAGPNLVLDDDRLPERCGQVLADQAREDVRTLAWREWNDEPDRLVGIGGSRDGGQCCGQQARRQAGEGGASAGVIHVVSSDGMLVVGGQVAPIRRRGLSTRMRSRRSA